ncbi:MAG: hypothetical protein KF763_14620 [Cyclobacteriaceae bacterium]|nr:hypothetical protein [Cyclobacteriaceae bacterium]
MKLQLINKFLALATLVACIFLMACGGDEPTEPTPAEQVRALLITSEWRMQRVQVDGVDKTDVYNGLKLQFSTTGFTATSGKAIWPATGTWSFTDDTATKLKRNDGLEIRIKNITAAQLELELNWTTTTLGSGRVGSVAGTHVFTFVK